MLFAFEAIFVISWLPYMGTFLIFALLLPFYSASNVSPFVTDSPLIRSTNNVAQSPNAHESISQHQSPQTPTATHRYLATESLASPINTVMQLGVPLGLCLGSSIFAAIALLWIKRGGFEPNTSTEWILALLCFCAWVSNTVFEVWTLDQPRKILLGLKMNNQQCWTKARAHIIIQAFLCIGITISLLINSTN